MNCNEIFDEILDILTLLTNGMAATPDGRDYLKDCINKLRMEVLARADD